MRLILSLIAICALTLASAAAGTPALLGHRAVYDLSMLRADNGSGIEDIDGRIAIEWSRQCDGYILNQRVVMRLENVQGKTTISDYRVAAWESLDGTRFRYSLRNEVDGKAVEVFDGKARLQAPGGAGEARFDEPEAAVLALPKGTLFPTAHIRAMLEAVGAGERTLARLTFDGSDEKQVIKAFAVLGAKRIATPESLKKFKLLAAKPHWPIRIGYFKHTKSGGAPEVELDMLLFENGVLGQLELDYGNFSVGGVLTKLELVEESGC